MVVGRLLSYWVSVTFGGRAVKLREGMLIFGWGGVGYVSTTHRGPMTTGAVPWLVRLQRGILLMEEILHHLGCMKPYK